ncbi:hypothetical protein V5O48_017457 [Marasmius crinis-equi]|uniref:Uncharacterized protein n=1 Tax=Marasmius crinis-equi TaxID=585013 RepID=A0ABR3EP23_9AGAR
MDTRPGLDYLIRDGKYDELLRQLLNDFKVDAAYVHFVLRVFEKVPVYRESRVKLGEEENHDYDDHVLNEYTTSLLLNH